MEYAHTLAGLGYKREDIHYECFVKPKEITAGKLSAKNNDKDSDKS